MPLTIPNDFRLYGGQWISKCTGSTIAVPTHVCRDLDGCGIEDYRVSKRALQMVSAAVDPVTGCITKRLVASLTFSALIYTGEVEALRPDTGDVEDLQDLLFIGNGLVTTDNTSYSSVTGAQLGPNHISNITSLCSTLQ